MSNFLIEGPGGVSQIKLNGGYNSQLAITTTKQITGGSFLSTGGTAPAAVDTVTVLGAVQNTTPTAAQLLGGILTHASATGAGTATLPTGTLMSAAIPGVVVGYTFRVLYVNIGTQTVTITGATGTTVVGTATVGASKSTELIFVNTGTNTWNIYTKLSA